MVALKSLCLVLVLFVFCLFRLDETNGCPASGENIGNSDWTPSNQASYVIATQNTGTLRVAATIGQELVLKIKANPTTGYTWQSRTNLTTLRGVELAGCYYEREQTHQHLIGGGG